MGNVRSGPSIAEFLEYYLLVLLEGRPRSKREMIAAIREESAGNRSFRPSGVLRVAAAEVDAVLRRLEHEGLAKAECCGTWRATRAGRRFRRAVEAERRPPQGTKERAAAWLVGLMEPRRRGERILDVGTGQGFLAVQLARPGSVILAIDSHLSEKSEEELRRARARARRRGARLEFREADVRELEPRAQFDFVVSSQAVHCMDDQEACLAAIGRLVKPGGRFLCMDFCVGVEGYLAHGFHSFLALSAEEWGEVLPRCGFLPPEVFRVRDYVVVRAQRPADAR